MLAGLTMTYRGAFKEGDRVRIGDVLGKVEDVKLMVTRIRTPKNEIVVIPNTTVLDSNIVNYTAMAREGQLMAYRHTGFWQCMDTLRDKRLLQDLWDAGDAPWDSPWRSSPTARPSPAATSP